MKCVSMHDHSGLHVFMQQVLICHVAAIGATATSAAAGRRRCSYFPMKETESNLHSFLTRRMVPTCTPTTFRMTMPSPESRN